MSPDDILTALSSATQADLTRLDEEIASLTKRLDSLRAIRPAVLATVRGATSTPRRRGKAPQLIGKIRDVIRHTGPLTVAQLTIATGGSRMGIYNAIAKAGDLVSDDQGRWAIKESGNV